MNTRMMALNSSSVMTPAAMEGLETGRVVLPMPARFISFQMGPDEPSVLPKSTASRWRWKTKRMRRLPAARRSASVMTGSENPPPCSTR